MNPYFLYSDKLHSMEKQLSKLTGLVQQAFLKGQSLGDLVNGDEMAESVLTQTGKKANAAPTASTASREFSFCYGIIPILFFMNICMS